MPDKSLGQQVGELAGAYSGLVREIALDRQQRDIQHTYNVKAGDERNAKLDLLLGLKPVVDSHEEWIETDGKRVVRIVDTGVAQVAGARRVISFGSHGVTAVVSVGTAIFGPKLWAVITAALFHG